MSSSEAPRAPRISLPKDEELPPEIRDTLAALPPMNVFRILGRAPASFKSFVALDMSLHVATGLWLHRECHPAGRARHRQGDCFSAAGSRIPQVNLGDSLASASRV